MLKRAALYLHTARYLQPRQIAGRIWRRLRRPRPNLRPAPPLRSLVQPYTVPHLRGASMEGPASFVLLGLRGQVSDRHAWDDPAATKLWRYNLHYFDDLNAVQAEQRTQWHRALVLRWLHENPPGAGTGWEPYPTSLRVVNWAKWAWRGNALDDEARQSLAVQARWIADSLEWHLLGNHLLANAKALMHAGALFDGAEAASWAALGRQIWEAQLAEQVLPDGGHFERSPMYHSLVLEDLLDTINLCRACGWTAPAHWAQLAARMSEWLWALSHPDGEIAFFNDAAFGVAGTARELQEYAGRLGLAPSAAQAGATRALTDSGYFRLEAPGAVLLADCAPLGPDYLPGHAHADTLSFELSLQGRRVLVNSGTSQYGEDAARQRQRGTAAHNTVVVDGADSSEVWAGFRVAQRARPGATRLEDAGGATSLESSHDGYRRLRGRNLHRRSWLLAAGSLSIVDRVTQPYDAAEARFHLHPDVSVVARGAQSLDLQLPAGGSVRMAFAGAGNVAVVPSSWHPEFGRSVDNQCVVATIARGELETRLSWSVPA